MLHAKSNRRPQTTNHQLQHGELERRDWQLWSIALLLIMTLTSGIVVTRAPELAVKSTLLDLCLLALCMLAMFFCAYAIQTVSALRASRRRLADAQRAADHVV